MLNSTRLQVPTMRSAEATREVSDALVNVQGVADIGVDPDRGVVEVKFDPEKTNESAIRQAVNQSGHQAQE